MGNFVLKPTSFLDNRTTQPAPDVKRIPQTGTRPWDSLLTRGSTLISTGRSLFYCYERLLYSTQSVDLTMSIERIVAGTALAYLGRTIIHCGEEIINGKI